MPCFEWEPPVFVFWLWPWPKPGLMRSVIGLPGAALAVLVDHVGRAAVDVDVVLDDQIEGLAVEDVGRVDDFRRVAGLPWFETGGDRAMDFAGAHGIDQHAVPAHEVENGQIRTGLLGEANDVEGLEVGDPVGDGCRVVNVEGSAKLASQFSNRLVGDVGEGEREWRRIHLSSAVRFAGRVPHQR